MDGDGRSGGVLPAAGAFPVVPAGVAEQPGGVGSAVEEVGPAPVGWRVACAAELVTTGMQVSARKQPPEQAC